MKLCLIWLMASVSLFAQIDGDMNLEINILARNITSGMEMTIANDGRVFIAEREGKVKLYDPSTGDTTTVLELETHLEKEAGFMGIALDPNFDQNSWIYLYHTLPPEGKDATHHDHVLGRFEFKNGQMLKESEKVLLKVRAAFKPGRIHEAGSIAFGPDGLLYLSTGDNQIRSEYLFSCKTSANTNDLRGKILRIKPEADGTYSIPEGNLFPEGRPKTRPEIYIMGLRNPFRISVDQKYGWLLWGENGPPNKWVPGTNLNTKDIPDGYDEFNLAKKPGFYGYPMIIADQQAFTDYDFKNKKSLGKFSVNEPLNNHPDNTGLQKLPASQPPLLWYEGKQKEFPELGSGGESAIAGPIYRSLSTYPAETKLPSKYDDCWIIGEYARGWIKAVKLDEQGAVKKIMPVLPALTLGSPTNIKIGPNGQIYILYFVRSGKGLMGAEGYLVRLENKGSSKNAIAFSDVISKNELPKGMSKNDSGIKMMEKSDCFTCHQWTEKRIGPSFMEIAQKYKGQQDKVSKTLIDRVIKGGSGVWGPIPMMPHPQHKESEVLSMIKSIFKLNELKEH